MTHPKPRGRYLKSRVTRAIRWSVVWGVACLPLTRATAAEAPAPITRIHDVLALSSSEAALGVPIQVRGVITWQEHNLNFTLQDDTGGIYVNVNEALKTHFWQSGESLPKTLHEGLEVELDGRSYMGALTPDILPSALRVLGTKPMPPAVQLERAYFIQGTSGCHRIEVQAVVQGIYPRAFARLG